MLRWMCKSKIHRATITDANLNYEGSITIDRSLLLAADILPHEMVQVVNIANGARFETYAIEGRAGSGKITLNGAAARLGAPGDKVIIISSIWLEEEKARRHRPVVIKVDDKNRIKK
jgi:aspartate 1-decarboxylase